MMSAFVKSQLNVVCICLFNIVKGVVKDRQKRKTQIIVKNIFNTFTVNIIIISLIRSHKVKDINNL